MLNFLRSRADLNEILHAVSEDCTPAGEKIFRAALPVEQIRVVILGQDPYPQPGVATGLAFEVGGLHSWKQPFRQVSLKNIVRLLYASYTGADPYAISYGDVIAACDRGDFSLLPPDRLFSYWAENGVLLMNTALTCKPGYPGSHAALWQPLTDDLITYIENRAHPVWFLWGKSAGQYKGRVERYFASRHPMLSSPKWEDDFLKNPCFRQTASMIDWLG